MKHLFILLSFLTVSLSAQISTAWTCTIPKNNLPVGVTIPTVTTLVNPTTRDFLIDLDGTTYDNATETTAFTAIGNATKTAIDSNWIVDTFGLDESLDIVGRIIITGVSRRFDNFEPNNLRDQYTAATNVFRVTGRFEWIKE